MFSFREASQDNTHIKENFEGLLKGMLDMMVINVQSNGSIGNTSLFGAYARYALEDALKPLSDNIDSTRLTRMLQDSEAMITMLENELTDPTGQFLVGLAQYTSYRESERGATISGFERVPADIASLRVQQLAELRSTLSEINANLSEYVATFRRVPSP